MTYRNKRIKSLKLQKVEEISKFCVNGAGQKIVDFYNGWSRIR